MSDIKIVQAPPNIEGPGFQATSLDKIIGFDMYTAVMHGSAELVNKWLNACDFILHPSSTEGFGLVIIEAQAAGTPVVINNVMSMPELINEGKTGFGSTSSTKIWSPGGGYIHIPDTNSIYDAMEKTYQLIIKVSQSLILETGLRRITIWIKSFKRNGYHISNNYKKNYYL